MNILDDGKKMKFYSGQRKKNEYSGSADEKKMNILNDGKKEMNILHDRKKNDFFESLCSCAYFTFFSIFMCKYRWS